MEITNSKGLLYVSKEVYLILKDLSTYLKELSILQKELPICKGTLCMQTSGDPFSSLSQCGVWARPSPEEHWIKEALRGD